MKLLLTRESVCAGDDIDLPHDARHEIEADKLEDALLWIARCGFLPTISGGRATWSAASNMPIAVFAQQWDSPRILLMQPLEMHRKRFKYDGDFLQIHFNYHMQIDPEIAVEVLRRYRHG